jgi:glutamate-5-semialdehyde dehydrogenase
MGVCNACESLVIHKDIAEKAIPAIAEDLLSSGIEIRGDKASCTMASGLKAASEDDFYTEYGDALISVCIVDSVETAIEHINRCSTHHSEAIVTGDPESAEKFLNGVDSAAVYVNASTRFTDGFEFGFGAEIGISTQKLHARGPMGLLALTSTKYVIYGDGQVRK